MKNIVALAASNSKRSINKQLISYVSEHIIGFKTNILDLNDLDLPMITRIFKRSTEFLKLPHDSLK